MNGITQVIGDIAWFSKINIEEKLLSIGTCIEDTTIRGDHQFEDD